MELRIVFKTARCVTVEAIDGSIFERKLPGIIWVNGERYGDMNRVVSSIYGLEPDTDYEICLEQAGEKYSVKVHTDHEFVTLNVRDFGAAGDGSQDDTSFIQAAVLACPKESRVLIPEGTYKVTSLFLKSGIRLELAKGAELLADTDRTRYPKFPGSVESCDRKSEYILGTWEGDPFPMYAGIITGIGVEDVVLYGEGRMDGCASYDNWWKDAKVMRGAYRPRMIFLSGCKNVTVQGLQIENSPSWVIHPFFSKQLRFIDLTVKNPEDSPNTDGLDPESCSDVEILGIHFSLGDDCIAIKSGKIYMGRKYKTPSENIRVRQCLMESGHGAVTVGSEIGAGAKDIHVEQCLFRHTDRGLRIKTRRGRGEDSMLTDIYFDRIRMEHVLTPFVVNCFYFCDPDGKSDYVQEKTALPVDERTPFVGRLYFSNIEAVNCHVAAAYLYGLPERKIERVEFDRVRVSFAADAEAGMPAMLVGVSECAKKGFFVANTETLVCRDVEISGQEGDEFQLSGVEHFEQI